MPSPCTPCISSALLCNPECLLQAPCKITVLLCNPGCLHQAHPVYYQHCFVTQGVFSEHTLYIPNRARVTTPVNSNHRPPMAYLVQDAFALTHLELDRKSPSHSWPLAPLSQEGGLQFDDKQNNTADFTLVNFCGFLWIFLGGGRGFFIKT